MALYVERPPAPPAGADWSYTVPGRYLERIVGVTATLGTFATMAAILTDVSGNGNDGIAFWDDPSQIGRPGLVAGDTCISGTLAGAPDKLMSAGVPDSNASVGPFDAANPFSIGYWSQPLAANLPQMHLRYGPGPFDYRTFYVDEVAGNRFMITRDAAGNGGDAQTAVGSIPADAALHFYGYEWDGAVWSFFYDGAQIATFADTGAPFAGANLSALIISNSFQNQCGTNTNIDEPAVFPTALAPATWAAMFAAATVDFATYTAAVLAAAPAGYYHLDITDGSGGRTPGLYVSDGTDETVLIPDGFAAQATPGPYQYSWSPTLRAANRDPTGTITSVPLPELILPAGYVLGTRTPDLQPSDQWSDIVIWWNDDVQQSTIALDEIVYPPGAYLIIVPAGV